MREIKFRGKRIDNGEWVYGFLSKGRLEGYQGNTLQLCIDHEEKGVMLSSVINPESVGQYTGLTDKNGKKIFEGDILRYRETETDGWDVGVVEYKADHDYPAFDMTPYIDCDSNGLSYIMAACTCEAIGNIHDNPELLEESK